VATYVKNQQYLPPDPGYYQYSSPRPFREDEIITPRPYNGFADVLFRPQRLGGRKKREAVGFVPSLEFPSFFDSEVDPNEPLGPPVPGAGIRTAGSTVEYAETGQASDIAGVRGEIQPQSAQEQGSFGNHNSAGTNGAGTTDAGYGTRNMPFNRASYTNQRPNYVHQQPYQQQQPQQPAPQQHKQHVNYPNRQITVQQLGNNNGWQTQRNPPSWAARPALNNFNSEQPAQQVQQHYNKPPYQPPHHQTPPIPVPISEPFTIPATTTTTTSTTTAAPEVDQKMKAPSGCMKVYRKAKVALGSGVNNLGQQYRDPNRDYDYYGDYDDRDYDDRLRRSSTNGVLKAIASR
jgi:hypothetical protein